MTKQEMLDKFRAYNPSQDITILEKAYDFAQKAHSGQLRASGDPYFENHCMAVADILLDHKLDIETICAGLLHDILEDTPYKVADLEK
ncbi:MAG: HD domain-containing protein, partial [Elusimicrobium sp.]|nr:HD domain-containing protein [Elusimicrobium sp.]